jgi:two-component system response regulator PrrA
MHTSERRVERLPDRRRVARGGRRVTDRAGKYPNLLVADSYTGARKPCARYLDLFNFHVEEAASGEEALARIQAGPPQVILAELTLPGMGARELSTWLDERVISSRIPVIVMMSEFEGRSANALPGGVAGVLVKPFPLATMIEEVRRVLRSRAQAS